MKQSFFRRKKVWGHQGAARLDRTTKGGSNSQEEENIIYLKKGGDGRFVICSLIRKGGKKSRVPQG